MFLLGANTGSALPCTICPTEASLALRERIAGHDFGSNLVAITAPFAVLGVLVLAGTLAPRLLEQRSKRENR